MYSKGAGKGGKHSWVNKETNIASVSNVSVQLWEHWTNRDFRSIVKNTASHYAYRYAHIPSQRVLYVATSNERLEGATLERIRLTNSLFGIWERIQAELPRVTSVVAGLLRKSRSVDDDDD
jgi:hypothetical protein